MADRPAAPLSQRVQAERAALEERKRVLSARISGRYRVSPIVARKIVDSAHLAGQRHQVDPLLLLAISAVESSFNPQAVSSAGAVGLIQAMPTAHPEKFARLKASGKSPFDAAVSLDLGGQIYAEYWRRLGGDRVLALQQYNGSLKDPKRRYSNKVLAAYAFLADGLPKAPPPA